MIAELAQDLLTKLQAIPALATSCGLDLLGDMPDPGAAKITPPAAWIIPKKAINPRDRAEAVPATITTAEFEFVVGLYLPTSAQIATQLPLLQSVIKAVQGQTSASGQRWFWRELDRAATNPGVMVYAITFSVNAGF